MEQKLSPSKVNEKRLYRNIVFRALYAMELGGVLDIALIDMVTLDVQKRSKNQITLNDEEKQNLIDAISEIFKLKDDLDLKIEKFLVNWKMDRISLVDLSILRMSVYDLMYRKDVPNNVVISEAVLLSTDYCDDKSKKFINGVLSSVLKSFESSDEDTKNA